VNGYVPSTVHQCVVQWIGDQVEVVEADEVACVAMTETQMDVQDGCMECLTGQDLTDYDYVSVRKDGFVWISVKSTTSSTRLTNNVLYMVSKEGDIDWLVRWADEYRLAKNNISEVVEDFDDIGKLGYGFLTVDELDEVDIGDGAVCQPTYVSRNLTSEKKNECAHS
jgi:hypothetical protein